LGKPGKRENRSAEGYTHPPPPNLLHKKCGQLSEKGEGTHPEDQSPNWPPQKRFPEGARPVLVHQEKKGHARPEST